MSDGERLARVLLILGENPSPLEDGLLRLDVEERRVPGTLSVNTVYQCAMAEGWEAFHKPHEGMREDPQLGMPVWQYFDQASAIATGINECAAWRVARAIGRPWSTLVPSGVMRWLPAEPGLVGGWGPLVHKGNGPSGRLQPLLDPSLYRPSALFDALIGQQDRHRGNQRYEAATDRLTLIDHGFSFPGGRWYFNRSVFVARRHEEGEAALDPSELDMLTKLLEHEVWQELPLMLAPEQMGALAWRVETMLDSGKLLPLGPEGFAEA